MRGIHRTSVTIIHGLFGRKYAMSVNPVLYPDMTDVQGVSLRCNLFVIVRVALY